MQWKYAVDLVSVRRFTAEIWSMQGGIDGVVVGAEVDKYTLEVAEDEGMTRYVSTAPLSTKEIRGRRLSRKTVQVGVCWTLCRPRVFCICSQAVPRGLGTTAELGLPRG